MPCLQQSAIHGEVLVAEQLLDHGSPHQLLQEAAHVMLVLQTLSVLGECTRVPNRIRGVGSPAQTSGTVGCS